jgi:hypothetical protein
MNLHIAVPRYAYLKAISQRAQAAGQHVDPQVHLEMQRLESAAAATLTPQELAQVGAGVDVLTAQHIQNFEVQAATRDAQKQGHFLEKISQETMGMSSDQMAAAIRGESKIPVKGKGLRAKQAKENFSQKINQEAKRLGYEGKDLTYNRWLQIVDKYTEKRDMRSPEVGRQYLEGLFKHVDAAESMIKGFENSGVDLRIGIAEKRGEDTDHYREVTEDEQRRATLVDAYAREAQKDSKTMDSMVDGISDEYLESDHIWGDVARAWVDAEAQETDEAVENYAPPQYDEEELQHAAI